jgi:UPF0716 protein FxsA
MTLNLMPVFILFLVVPVAEIYLLMEVGSLVGVPWTIFLVVLTAVVGAWLVRLQGTATWRRFRRSLYRDGLPAMELIEGLCLLIAGALLLTPGFFTDVVGFACLTPPLRRAVIRHLLRRGLWTVPPGQAGASPSSRSLDGDYEHIED